MTVPRRGDVSPSFIAEVGWCWRMLYDRDLQATHYDKRPVWTGRWRSPRDDCWWVVWVCPDIWTG